MAFDISNIVLRYSVAIPSANGRSEGDASDPVTPANAALRSIGRYMSTAAIPLGTSVLLDNLFADIGGAQNELGAGDTRCIFLLNQDSATAPNLRFWISEDIPGGASMQFACDPNEMTPRSFVGAGSPLSWQTGSCQDAGGVLSDEESPRRNDGTLAGYAFAAPTSPDAAIVIGNLPAGYCVALWMKRQIPASSAGLAGDGFSLTFETG